MGTPRVQTRLLTAITSAFLLFACSDSNGNSDGDRSDTALDAALATISRDGIQSSLDYLAADEREGRMTGTRGYDESAQWVSEQFAALGLEPGGTDGWFQQVPLITRMIDPTNSGVTLGIPAVYLAEGIGSSDPAVDGRAVLDAFFATHYHQPSDDLAQPIVWETALRFARVGVRIGYRIAMEEQRPRWNEGDFFGDKFNNP